jgi:hypothetical protein
VINRSKPHPVAPGIMNIIPVIVVMAIDIDIAIDITVNIAI